MVLNNVYIKWMYFDKLHQRKSRRREKKTVFLYSFFIKICSIRRKIEHQYFLFHLLLSTWFSNCNLFPFCSHWKLRNNFIYSDEVFAHRQPKKWKKRLLISLLKRWDIIKSEKEWNKITNELKTKKSLKQLTSSLKLKEKKKETTD